MKVLLFGMRAKLCPIQTYNGRFRLHVPAVLFLALLFWFPRVLGQPKGEGSPSPAGSLVIKPLQVGEQMLPLAMELSWPSKSSLGIPDTNKGSITLLYFWDIYCAACWGKFGQLQALEEQYPGKLSIIAVCPQPVQKVEAFMKGRPALSGSRLRLVNADTVLGKLFPHLFVSHVAWLNHAGKVLAITAADYISSANIQLALSGNTPGWKIKRDIAHIDPDQPLMAWNRDAGYNLEPGPFEYTLWTRYINGLDSRRYIHTAAGGLRVTHINASYYNLYAAAYQLPVHANRFVMPDSIRQKFFKPDSLYNDQWLERYGHCLELGFRQHIGKDSLRSVMKQLLWQRFGWKVVQDTAAIHCWKVSGNGEKQGGYRVASVVYTWNHSSPVPIVAHTAGAVLVSAMPAAADLTSFKSFEKWCRQHNLQATEGTAVLPFISISP